MNYIDWENEHYYDTGRSPNNLEEAYEMLHEYKKIKDYIFNIAIQLFRLEYPDYYKYQSEESWRNYFVIEGAYQLYVCCYFKYYDDTYDKMWTVDIDIPWRFLFDKEAFAAKIQELEENLRINERKKKLYEDKRKEKEERDLYLKLKKKYG